MGDALLFAVGWSCSEEDPLVALDALEECIALTREGAVDAAFGAVLTTAAQIKARNGDARAALADLREAIAYSRDVGDQMNFTFSVARGVLVAARAGQAELAALFSGVTEGPGLTAPQMLPADEVAARDDALARVREQLGDAAFATARAHGEALNPDEVAPYVLQELDLILEELPAE